MKHPRDATCISFISYCTTLYFFHHYSYLIINLSYLIFSVHLLIVHVHITVPIFDCCTHLMKQNITVYMDAYLLITTAWNLVGIYLLGPYGI